MLNQYLSNTRQLLQNPPASTALYPTADLTNWINLARSQLAGENECIRVYGTLPLLSNVQTAAFTSVDTSSVPGVAGVLNLKQLSVQVGAGALYLHPRSFQWFNLYLLSQVVPVTARPTTYTQYSQGVNGSIFVYPIPDQDYTLNVDAVCYPIPLVDDSTVEAIPYPWTDCVPFYAAFYAYMGAQRQADADLMYKRYQEYSQRARGMSNPTVLQGLYPQSADQTINNKLGIQPARGGGG